MPVRRTLLFGTIALAALAACAKPAPPANAATLATMPWDSVLARARGQVVVWRMWRGDPSINTFIDTWVAPRLKQQYDITLRAVNGQGNELVDQLTVEKEAGAATGTASLLWINGETFGALRARGLLAGPWSHVLPSAAMVDSASPIITRDFEQDPAGYESPWGTVQQALIYDATRTPNPPRSIAELSQWGARAPGTVHVRPELRRHDAAQGVVLRTEWRRGHVPGGLRFHEVHRRT